MKLKHKKLGYVIEVVRSYKSGRLHCIMRDSNAVKGFENGQKLTLGQNSDYWQYFDKVKV